ncbi:hypothetical protein GBA52_027440 [Prunus armeniaca]|nr:hypothetical protein GBA52_027440 [Prunus armeniaca]
MSAPPPLPPVVEGTCENELRAPPLRQEPELLEVLDQLTRTVVTVSHGRGQELGSGNEKSGPMPTWSQNSYQQSVASTFQDSSQSSGYRDLQSGSS